MRIIRLIYLLIAVFIIAAGIVGGIFFLQIISKKQAKEALKEFEVSLSPHRISGVIEEFDASLYEFSIRSKDALLKFRFGGEAIVYPTPPHGLEDLANFISYHEGFSKLKKGMRVDVLFLKISPHGPLHAQELIIQSQ